MNKNAWPEEEQDELRQLFEEFKESEGMLFMLPSTLRDKFEQKYFYCIDIVGGILMSMTNKTRSRRQVNFFLKSDIHLHV